MLGVVTELPLYGDELSVMLEGVRLHILRESLCALRRQFDEGKTPDPGIGCGLTQRAFGAWCLCVTRERATGIHVRFS